MYGEGLIQVWLQLEDIIWVWIPLAKRVVDCDMRFFLSFF